MISLPQKIVLLHQALEDEALPHAFGGALALAWCTGQARGTIDIDVNVFVGVDTAATVFDALPGPVVRTAADLKRVRADGQVRLWWDNTPVDLFLNTTPFHDKVAARACWENFADNALPFLSCLDIAVFKAFFNRTKDWADLEAMLAAGTLDKERVSGVLVDYLGADDERVAALRQLLPTE